MPAAVVTPDQQTAVVRKPYPHFKIIVKNDNHNTFEHVIESFCLIIPHMMPEKALALAIEIHTTGAAVVWTGPQEQAELYHSQLTSKGLTVAPLEPCN